MLMTYVMLRFQDKLPGQAFLNPKALPGLPDHLAFNTGPRLCVGAALARAEMVDAIDILLDRLPGLRFDQSAPVPRFMNHYTRSFRPLHVLFDDVKPQ